MDPAAIRDDDLVRTEDGLVFNPYNPLNTEITLSDIQSILTRYGLPPNVYNMTLYKRAFVHRSYTKRPAFENELNHITIMPQPSDCLPLKTKSNERLEFLGDGILECVTKFMLYQRFPKANEGFMTEKKIAIVKNEAIGKIAYQMGLHKWILLSRNAEEKKTRTNLKKLGCLFEAFIGALFLDFNKFICDATGPGFEWFRTPGFQMAQTFIEHVFNEHIDWVELIQTDDNYKNILQVKVQKEFKVTPHYMQVNYNPETGYSMAAVLCIGKPIHSVRIEEAFNLTSFKGFKQVKEHMDANNGQIFLILGRGEHKIKRKAEQTACLEALQHLGDNA